MSLVVVVGVIEASGVIDSETEAVQGCGARAWLVVLVALNML